MKRIYILFICLCLAVCLLPFAGMAVRPTTVSTENRELSAFPSLLAEQGGLNTAFFSQFEQYFSEHFAFRNELVTADSRLQAGLFGVSAKESVILGKDGWLYYASTLRDYTGAERMSARERFALEHNLALADRAVSAAGARLVLAFPPNKNTLYGEHMPYYDAAVVDPVHEIALLGPELEDRGLAYADLLELFASDEEVYYLKQDSHWNNRGALLAFGCIQDALGRSHEQYDALPYTRAMDHQGDLTRMLYTFYGKPGADYYYDLEGLYRYTAGDDPEDPWIQTESDGGAGSLLMFRDSFGNTLLPFFASAYEKAAFTRESPYALETLLAQIRPEVVVFEKVERNLREFLATPPIVSAPVSSQSGEAKSAGAEVSLSAEPLEFDPRYLCLRGELPEELARGEAVALVEIDGVRYDSYCTGESGFLLYLKREALPAGGFEARVLVQTGDGLLDAGATTLSKEAAA